MKKILLLGLSVCMVLVASAQVPDRTKMTTTDADTLTFENVKSNVVSLTATYVETSGTSAGKFYFQGSVDGIGWLHIDSSKSISDVATAQTITVAVTATTYAHYRVIFSNTSSATGTFYFTILRRPDDLSYINPNHGYYAVSKFIPQSYLKSGEVNKHNYYWRRES